MARPPAGLWALLAGLTLIPASLVLGQEKPEAGSADQDKRPRVTVRAQPNVGSTPARIMFTAELIGGADDFEEYYCPTVIWEWGDDTVSESTVDCDPYEPDTTQIRRRHTVTHVFQREGRFRVYFRLRQRSKMVAAASVTVQIAAGAGRFP